MLRSDNFLSQGPYFFRTKEALLEHLNDPEYENLSIDEVKLLEEEERQRFKERMMNETDREARRNKREKERL